MQRLANIYNASLQLLTPKSLQETYATVVEQAKQLVGARHASIFILEGTELRRAYTSTKRLYRVKPRLGGLTYRAFINRQAFLRSGKELAAEHAVFKRHPVGSDILVPLTYSDVAIGTLSVMSAPEVEYTEEQLAILKNFSQIAALAIRNAVMRQDLKDALRVRDHFISMAAHEFRNPLTSILLHTQVLEKQIAAQKVPKSSQVAKIRSSANRLNRMVNELLNTSRIQQGKLQFKMKKIDLVQEVKRIVAEYTQKYPLYTFSFDYPEQTEPFWVYADPDKIYQVVVNILNNAIKFSEPHTTITVVVSSSGKQYQCTITDQGCGMEEDELKHVFERYYTGNKPVGARGLGLGLSLVKTIIDEHRGSVSVSSRPQVGTAVTVTLPKLSDG